MPWRVQRGAIGASDLHSVSQLLVSRTALRTALLYVKDRQRFALVTLAFRAWLKSGPVGAMLVCLLPRNLHVLSSCVDPALTE